ncbi:hypothetical protein P5673_012623 [Acropora cervicornis]|uniref:Uncharacterized protein n=1 Tax=Acropora cervicornis TaxID=6130 RepID=A0AAD9QLR8_ACRCE|nr:hypothetical protein P5673_012623 [Acropora cervicornis]
MQKMTNVIQQNAILSRLFEITHFPQEALPLAVSEALGLVVYLFNDSSQPDVSSRLQSLSLFSKSYGRIHSIELPYSSKIPSLAESMVVDTRRRLCEKAERTTAMRRI